MSFPITQLRDDFTDNVIGDLWINTYVPTGSATRAETGGQARFTLPSSTAGTHNAGYQSSQRWDLTADSVSINVDTMVSTSVAATAAFYIFDSNDVTNWIRFAQLSGNLNFQKSLAGVTTAIGTAQTWSASTHKYWRIRESAGTIYLDTSSNGTSWTNRGSVTTALSFVPTAVIVRMDATCGNVASPGSFRIEEINAIYPAPSSTWRETTADWSISNRLRSVTLSSDGGLVGAVVTADTMDTSRTLGGTVRYFAGPLGSSSGGFLQMTEYASLVLAQGSAFAIPLDGRVDLPTMVDARYMRLYHRSVGASVQTLYEYVPRRLVQADDIEAESIRAINIAAHTITADQIAAHTITATEIGTVNLDASARITAGGGAVLLDNNGIQIVASVFGGGHVPTSSLDWVDVLGGTRNNSIYGTFTAGVQTGLIIESLSDSTSAQAGIDLVTYPATGSGLSSASIQLKSEETSPAIKSSILYFAQAHLMSGGGVRIGGTSASGATDGQLNTSGNVALGDGVNSVTRLRVKGASASGSDYALVVVNSTPSVMLAIRNDNAIGFFGATEITRPTVTGSRAANAALTSLCTALSSLGLITNSTT